MTRQAKPAVGKEGKSEHDPFLETKYSAALEMWFHENQWYWNITTIFGLACTALLGFLALSGQTKSVTGNLLQVALAVIGMIFCAMWAAAAERSSAMRTLRIHQVRKLERAMGGGPLKDGEGFANGGEYKTLEDTVVRVSKMGMMARYKFSPVLASLFAIAFTLSGASSCYEFFR